MKPKYETAVYKSYKGGYYTFVLSNDVEMIFEEVHPKILLKYNLKDDKSLINKIFHLAFSETIEDEEDDFIIYRIEYLELINAN